MKKFLPTLSLILSSALVMTATATTTVYAEKSDTMETKTLDAYLYSTDDLTSVECLFDPELPDVPYIDIVDYYNNIYRDDVTRTRNDNGTYTVSNSFSSMVINTENDTIYFESFEKFMSNKKARNDGTMLDSPFTSEIDTAVEGEEKSVTIDLGKYDIDIFEKDNKVYFPLSTLSDLFFFSYNGAEYVDGKLYFVHLINEKDGSYFDKSPIFQTTERSDAMIKFNYNELCFVMDNLYGAPMKAPIAEAMQNNSFNQVLDDYSDKTRRAKELLLSSNIIDYCEGLAYLQEVFNDGGHTNLILPVVQLLNSSFSTPAGTEFMNRLQNPDEDFQVVKETLLAQLSKETSSQVVIDARQAGYADFELVKSWDTTPAIRYYQKDDMGVFSFDSFRNDAVYAFKWALDYAKETGVKKFVIDDSCNTGGSTSIVNYMIGIMTNSKNHTNIVSLRTKNTLTGNIFISNSMIDFNLDGEYNDLDKDVAYDFEFAMITSNVSFSCGNYLPVLAKDAGIPIFGQTSGGGSCGLSYFNSSENMLYTISGYNKIINAANEDADIGAPVNYDLTKKTVGDDGTEVIDYSGLYDFDTIGKLMDEFYTEQEEPSQEESSKEESSQQESSKEESSKEESTQQTSGITPGIDTPKTGDSAGTYITILILLTSVGAVIMLFRKKGER